MRNYKNGLDEMQKQMRNSIGNQMFMIMYWVLLLNCGLHGAGIKWLTYPIDVMVIITACMGVYLVRLIAFNAYLPPKANNKKPIIFLIIAIFSSIALVIAITKFLGQPLTQIVSDSNLTRIIIIIPAVAVIISLIVIGIKRKNSKDDDN